MDYDNATPVAPVLVAFKVNHDFGWPFCIQPSGNVQVRTQAQSYHAVIFHPHPHQHQIEQTLLFQRVVLRRFPIGPKVLNQVLRHRQILFRYGRHLFQFLL